MEGNNAHVRKAHTICMELAGNWQPDMPHQFHARLPVGAITVRLSLQTPQDTRTVTDQFVKAFMHFQNETGLIGKNLSRQAVSLLVNKAIGATCSAFGGGAGVFMVAHSVVRVEIAPGAGELDC